MRADEEPLHLAAVVPDGPERHAPGNDTVDPGEQETTLGGAVRNRQLGKLSVEALEAGGEVQGRGVRLEEQADLREVIRRRDGYDGDAGHRRAF